MTKTERQVDEITRLVGYVLIRRRGDPADPDNDVDEVTAKRIYDTEPEGPIVGSWLDYELTIGEHDEIVGVIPAAHTEQNPAEEGPTDR